MVWTRSSIASGSPPDFFTWWTGQTFAEIRLAVPAPYRELRDAVFEALGDGTMRQRFDDERGAMVLAKAS